MTKIKQQTVKRIKLEFAPGEAVTSFGGMAITGRFWCRLGVERLLEKNLPYRRGYTLVDVVKSAIGGLLTGARGTFATEGVRQDPAFLKLLGLSRAPEEATFWRALADAGEEKGLAGLEETTLTLARRAVERAPVSSVIQGGFFRLFIDATMLEGSPRREGTKYIGGKGEGLVWTVGFAGSFPVAQRLAASGEGEGEQTHAREILKRIDEKLLGPSGMRKKALVLMDSLHGNGPTLDVVEGLELRYVIGAGSLERTSSVLAAQPECQWTPTPEDDKARGVEDSGVCTAWIQCEGWKKKRLLVGRRWKRKGEMLWNYAGVLTNLERDDPRLRAKNSGAFARKVWALYDHKGACENHFKNLLTDLGLHHPPCQRWQRNAGFYAIGALAGLLASAFDVLTSRPSKQRRRIATLRRWVLAVPARIARHSRTITATVLGLSERWRAWLEDRFRRAARC